MTAPIKVTTRQGLLSGQFRTSSLHVKDGLWSSLDADNPDVRADLILYVPSHVRLAQGQEAELQAAGLKLDGAGAKLIDLRAPVDKAKGTKEKAPTRVEK